jgi:hypothetical protein
VIGTFNILILETETQRVGGVAQAIEYMPSKQEALSSNTITAKKNCSL